MACRALSIEKSFDTSAGKVTARVSQLYAHYENRLVEGAGGRPVVEFHDTDHGHNTLMGVSDSHQSAGVELRFVEEAPEQLAMGSQYGDLIVTLGSDTDRIPVNSGSDEVTVGGYRCRIVEFAPDFRVGREPQEGDAMNNPAIRVEVRDPEGHTHEKRLFAFHPDFDAGHAGEGQLHGDIQLVYDYQRRVYVFPDGDGISAISAFPVEVSTGTQPVVTRESGEKFVIVEGTSIRSGAFGVRAMMVMRSAVEAEGPTDNENAPPAIEVTLSDDSGNQGDGVVVKWTEGTLINLGGRGIRVSYGPVRKPLPYQLYLDDFVLVTYPGSNNPASFESHVRIFDEERGVDGTPVRIYMNNPLTYAGFKHFQSSYDQDRRGTVLSVNHDPGKWPTYVGYFLVGLGLLITLTRGMWLRNGKQAAAAALLILAPVAAQAQAQNHAPGHNHPIQKNYLSESARDALKVVMSQDFQGRMKPFDTLARESIMKVTKKHHWQGWEPIDMYLSWMAHPDSWYDKAIVAVRHPDVKQLLGVSPSTKHVTPASLMDESGQYRLAGEIDKAHRTPQKERSKMQNKLLSFDERVNVFYMAVRGISFKAYPIPNDENDRWISPGMFKEELPKLAGPVQEEFQNAFTGIYHGLQSFDNQAVLSGARGLIGLQYKYGANVIPSEGARNAELRLNRLQPFVWVSLPYLGLFFVLMAAYAWCLSRRKGKPFSLKNPLYGFGLLVYVVTMVYHLWAYVLRWQAAGHAPLSNGYESLIFISLAIAVGGFYYELRTRDGSIAALAALLTSVILGVAMLPTFDPAISPLVPVLASFWLIVHVTIITASYGFLGLAAVIAMTMLVLHLFKGPGRKTLRRAIAHLNGLHWNVMIVGLAFLSIGTFLGGVWANESWGRYWGWDPKETWALVTILVYAFVVHIKYVGHLNRPINIATGSFLSISTVGMTYFGVNYFLAGLHSYASGVAPTVPGWVYVMAVCMVVLVFAAYFIDGRKSWDLKKA